MGQTTVLQLPFAGGLDQKAAKYYLDPESKLATITDGNFVKTGAVDKRQGISHLTSVSATGGKLSSWSKSELTVATPQGLYSYSGALNALVGAGPLPPCRAIRRPLLAASPALGTTFPSTAAQSPNLCDIPLGTSTLRLAVYQGALTSTGKSTIYASVSDATTGELVLPPSLLYVGAGAPGRLTGAVVVQAFYQPTATSGQQVTIAYADMAQLALYARNYNPATNVISAQTTILASGGFTIQALDLVPYTGDPSGGSLLLYSDNGSRVVYKYLSSAFGTITSAVIDTAPGGQFVAGDMYALGVYGDSVWFIYAFANSTTTWHAKWTNYSADHLFLFVGSSSIANFAGGNAFKLIPPVGMGSKLAFTGFVQDTALTAPSVPGPGTTSIHSFSGQWQTLSAATTGAVDQGDWPLGMSPVSRGFVAGGTLYQPAELALCGANAIGTALAGSGVISIESQQGTLFLLQLQSNTSLLSRMLPVATIAPRQKLIGAQPIFPLTSTFPEPSTPLPSGQPGATRQAVALRVAGVDTAAESGTIASTWANDFYFDTGSQALLYQANELGQELHLSSATPFVFDGGLALEDSFAYYPEFSYASQSGSGSTLTGTYTYAVVYTYVDASGLLHRSVPAFTNAVTLSGAQNPVCNILSLSMTWRDLAVTGQSFPTVPQGAVYAEIYRTLSTPATPVFYFVDRVSVSNTNAFPCVPYIAYVDTTPDSAISVASQLYTTGGVLDNPCPPALAMQCVHKGRLWAIDETLRTIWFTQTFSSGLAPTWNELMTIQLPDGGDITAIAELDDKLIVFKAGSIWVVYGGDGLSITGTGSDITNPQRIASDVGAVDWRSVVLMPEGLMFLAVSGIYLLDRSLAVTWIGKEVTDSLAQFPTVVGATLIPTATQVRFTCVGAGGSAALVFDYELKWWTVHTYPRLSAPLASSSLSQGGAYSLLSTDGQLWQEGSTFFDQDSTGTPHFVPTVITTAALKLQGVQGYQRCRRALLSFAEQDDCGLSIGLAVNYQPTIVQTGIYSAAQVDVLPPGVPVDMHLAGAYNKGMAVQFTFSDSQGPGAITGQGARFASYAVELDAIGGRYRQVPPQGRS